MDNHKFCQGLSDGLIAEMGTTFRYHFNRTSKSCDYLLIYKSCNVVSISIPDSSSIGPFCQVVHGYYNVLDLVSSCCWLDRANII